jgi:tRNA A-37 threonylcarbamoyl transferase component Bud32
MMWNLCRDLKAFYAKVGQLIAMQAFVPEIIRTKLARLQDDMPPLPSSVTRRIIEQELRLAHAGSIEHVFKSLDLENVLGCASIAQVHYGVLREGNTPVAVKVQQPDAKLLMASDLSNFRLLAEILQKTELKFDLVGPVKELSKQLRLEFDFENEAKSMNIIRKLLLGQVHGVRIPKSIVPLVTPRLLVMEFLEGLPLSRLSGRVTNPHLMRKFGRKAIKRISDAYGEMILTHGIFQADPHPGNILILNRRVDIGIIDFGQTKCLCDKNRYAFAELVDAMARRHPPSVAAAMASLGIVIEHVPVQIEEHKRRGRSRFQRHRTDESTYANNAPTAVGHPARATAIPPSVRKSLSSTSEDVSEVRQIAKTPSHGRTGATSAISRLTAAEQLAYTMFDTAEFDGVSSNPFSEKSALRTATVKALPQDLFFLLRTLQIIRGICAATGNADLSVANAWAPLARKALRSRQLHAPATSFMP